MNKISRNAPCPCGSNKKFKKCHGSLAAQEAAKTPLGGSIMKEVARTSAAFEAKRVQQRRQQGLGKPILSKEFNGHRLVFVGDELTWSTSWKTFPDFLAHYIKHVFGEDWWLTEANSIKSERHPILLLANLTYEQQVAVKEEIGGIHTTAATGAMIAYFGLAYDLFCIQHNVVLQAKLVQRLKHFDQYGGARYEVFVAAALVRAGFLVEFENEDDRSSTHCEFTATHKITGRKFSVEAKRSDSPKLKIGGHLNKALGKCARYERIIFIDLNKPDDIEGNKSTRELLIRAVQKVREFENKPFKGIQAPQAYLVISNLAHHHHPTATQYCAAVLMEGFRIPDFKHDQGFQSVRAAVEAKERHREMFELGASIQDHSYFPSTFDGEIPEFAFGEAERRLVVGNVYEVMFNSKKRCGRLTSATVNEVQKVIHCAYHFEDTDEAAIFTTPMSNAEFTGWLKHPDTYFGVVANSTKQVRDPVELFDFFMSANRLVEKQKLLEWMADSPDISTLGQLSQVQLAREYCIRLASDAWMKATSNAVEL